MYKIGIYKAGQQFAKSVYESENLEDLKKEFIRMFDETEFCPEGTDNEPENGEQAWEYKRFQEDTNIVAVFKCENEDDSCTTNYCNQGCRSNQL